MQRSPSQHADLLLQNSSGAGLHSAASPTALGRQCDSEGGFQPQKVGDEGSVSCSATQHSCRVLRCHFPIWKVEVVMLTHLVSYALQISMYIKASVKCFHFLSGLA